MVFSRVAQHRSTLRVNSVFGRFKHILVCGKNYAKDDWTNIPDSILAKLDAPSLLAIPNHPLSILKYRIENSLPDFASLTAQSPIVTVAENFDDLGFPLDHPGRSKTDSYYINQNFMLRTHTSAHEIANFRSSNSKWILAADVYRRDEIDSSHYPVFHQMEGARVFPVTPDSASNIVEKNDALSEYLSNENILIEDNSHIAIHNPVQSCHNLALSTLITANLKLTLNRLIVDVFQGADSKRSESPLHIRWIDAYFPWTSPSFEVEVHFQGKWLEILGCGIVNDRSLFRAGA